MEVGLVETCGLVASSGLLGRRAATGIPDDGDVVCNISDEELSTRFKLSCRRYVNCFGASRH